MSESHVHEKPSAPELETIQVTPEPTLKEKRSAYFTIAAAAFGLISDGCEYLDLNCLSYSILILLHCQIDQNSIMTMTNVNADSSLYSPLLTWDTIGRVQEIVSYSLHG